jgi:4a-hydroxytetrahydrobiopterin dehydratase
MAQIRFVKSNLSRETATFVSKVRLIHQQQFIMWREENNRLKKTFTFRDFTEAFSFMTRVAFVAEKMNHHPHWTNVYNSVSFELSTHDAGDTITELDHQLAEAIDKLA